ncbi:MAG TPA: radical SAM protein [Cyanobacteria bacterium UBA8530]|nr:radical SAM protein [Cyanobacteria bacterium UBA8530]
MKSAHPNENAEKSVYQLGQALYLNITNRCQNRCTFCIRDLTNEVSGVNLWLEEEPGPADVLAEVERKMESRIGEIKEFVFCGFGEPLSRLEAAIAIAEGLKKYSLPVRLNTNGLANLVYERDVVPEIAGKFDQLSVSLNAPDAEEYEKLCRSIYGLEAFPAVLDFLESCQKNEVPATATVVEREGLDVEACRTLAESRGFPLRIREYLPAGY